MIRVPRITPSYRTLVRDEASSALIGPDRYAVIGGALARRILDEVDGTSTVDDIVARLEGDFEAARVYYTLLLLEAEGFVEEGPVPRAKPRPRSPPAAGAGAGEGHVMSRTAERGAVVVRISADARLDRREALDRISAAWDTLPPTATEGDAEGGVGPRVRGILGIATDYLDGEIRGWWREARELGLPLLLLALRGEELWVGPEIGHDGGACPGCLAEWIEGTHAHVRIESEDRADVRDLRESQRDHTVRDPSFTDRIVSRALGAVHGWTSGSGPSEYQGVIHRWAGSDEPELHRVLRRPECECCGEPVRSSGPPRLATRPKHRGAPDGSRIEPPERTYDRLRKHVSPIVGAVRHLTRVEGPDSDLVHTYTSAHAVPVETPGLHTLKTTSRDRCGGKGATDMAARVSALCEALERYSAVYRGTELRVFGTALQLGRDGVDPRRILGFSDAQYAAREKWNARATGRFHQVPVPFDMQRWMSWTPAWSLSELRTRFVPTSMCYFGYSGPGEEIARADSNGLAAGNCIEEAIVQAFLELVERDAVAIWWYNRTRQPELSLRGTADPYIQGTLRLYDRLGRRLWVLDLTTDLGIPVFAAVSAAGADGMRPEGSGGPLTRGEIIMGFGAHFDRDIALRRALAELGQALPLALASDEDRRRTLLPDHPLALHWWRNETLETQPYLVPAGVRTLDEFASYESADLLDDVRECIVRARRVGLEVLCVDLTRPEIDLHVARVFVPGLRHFWRRLAPGRLYDVPVALGRIEAPLPEDALNPLPMFL